MPSFVLEVAIRQNKKWEPKGYDNQSGGYGVHICCLLLMTLWVGEVWCLGDGSCVSRWGDEVWCLGDGGHASRWGGEYEVLETWHTGNRVFWPIWEGRNPITRRRLVKRFELSSIVKRNIKFQNQERIDINTRKMWRSWILREELSLGERIDSRRCHEN